MRDPIIHTQKNSRIFSFFILTNLISRSTRGRQGGREGVQARRERGVSILYFQRCIKHIATVTGQQQVPAQQVPREQSLLSLLPPLSLHKRTRPTCLCTGCPEWVGGWQRLTHARGKQVWWNGSRSLGSEPGRLVLGGHTWPEFRALPKSFRPFSHSGQWKWFHFNNPLILALSDMASKDWHFPKETVISLPICPDPDILGHQ